MNQDNVDNGKAVVVTVSDMHINSSVALCKPVINLDDGGTYHANRTQRWLWECWNDLWKRLGSMYDDTWRKLLLFNGDMGELDTQRRTIQLITPNKATVTGLVFDTIAPAVDWADKVVVIRGTIAHTGKSAWLEEAIANDISNCYRYSKEAPASWWHMRTTIDGVRADIAHHASMSGLPWTRKNSAVRLASKTLWQYKIQRDQPAPQLVIRSHNHICEDVVMEGCHVWYTPSWTTLTEYGYRMGHENDLAHIGAVVAECEDGKESSHKITYEPKGEKKIWAMKI